jgi:hypothetical protein
LHKNKSFTIIQKALYNYFVHGLDPKKYIKTNKNIFDFCGQTKVTRNWKFKYSYVKDGTVCTENLQKTLRFYISNKGGKIIKNNVNDDRDINVVSGKWLQKIFNKYQDVSWSDYDIDYGFYLDKINKEIKSMSPELFTNQISLF